MLPLFLATQKAKHKGYNFPSLREILLEIHKLYASCSEEPNRNKENIITDSFDHFRHRHTHITAYKKNTQRVKQLFVVSQVLPFLFFTYYCLHTFPYLLQYTTVRGKENVQSSITQYKLKLYLLLLFPELMFLSNLLAISHEL